MGDICSAYFDGGIAGRASIRWNADEVFGTHSGDPRPIALRRVSLPPPPFSPEVAKNEEE